MLICQSHSYSSQHKYFVDVRWDSDETNNTYPSTSVEASSACSFYSNSTATGIKVSIHQAWCAHEGYKYAGQDIDGLNTQKHIHNEGNNKMWVTFSHITSCDWHIFTHSSLCKGRNHRMLNIKNNKLACSFTEQNRINFIIIIIIYLRTQAVYTNWHFSNKHNG